MTLTVLTMIWECSFIYNYKKINVLSTELVENNTHVWTNDYDLTYLLPWKLSFIFYAEYGAHADREYMITTDNWSRIIESTHAIFCGLFAFLVLFSKIKDSHINKYILAIGISMGSQLMNSILYMSEYFIQEKEINNINYCSPVFPCGTALSLRGFMYVNIFWTVMPSYIIIITWKNTQLEKPTLSNSISYSKCSQQSVSIIPQAYQKSGSLF